MGGVTLDTIEEARARMGERLRLTPLWPAVTLSGTVGQTVELKCEHLQLTGSFKIRGATNFVDSLDAEEEARGLVAASAGNHAQGVAYAARARGISATVVMPERAPLTKVTATRRYGANVVLHGKALEEAKEEALRIAEREGRIYVPPFDDDRIIAGQGTLGLEVLEQSEGVSEIVVPAGGGGLLSGVAVAAKSLRPDVRVIGVQTRAMDAICRSVAEHQLVETGSVRTIADGIAVEGPSPRTFALIDRYVDEMVSVTEEQIARAILMLVEQSRMIVEGAGAVAVAALLAGVYVPHGKTVAVLSGGNLDINLLGSIVRRGLVDAGRYQHLSIRIVDRPGTLAGVARIIAEHRGDILEVNHDRESRGVPLGAAMLDLLIEVDGEGHFADIIHALDEAGYQAGAAALP